MSGRTYRADRQIDAVFTLCNKAIREAMAAAERGSGAKADAFFAATVNVADLLQAIEDAGKRLPPTPTT